MLTLALLSPMHVLGSSFTFALTSSSLISGVLWEMGTCSVLRGPLVCSFASFHFFPCLYRLSTIHDVPISCFLVLEGNSFSWNLHFFRNLNDRDSQSVEVLLDHLLLFHLSDQADRKHWIPKLTTFFWSSLMRKSCLDLLFLVPFW